MQQLFVELKNASEGAPQVPCSVSGVLNRDKSLSVPCIVLADNNSDEDQHSDKSGQALSVPVINMRGKPLIPTQPGKARILLQQGKAIVIQRAPFTIQHKLETHLRLIKKLKKILPVTKIGVEVASFDIQKTQNPEIKGIEYQQGKLQGYEVKKYMLEKWKHKCAYCGKINLPLEIEHIIPKLRGGTDRVSNLAIACHKCNQKKGNQTAAEFGHPEIHQKTKQTLKETAFMNNC